MLKQAPETPKEVKADQPPSGGCVLKRQTITISERGSNQPPSGGCVLKQAIAEEYFATKTSRLRAAVC